MTQPNGQNQNKSRNRSLLEQLLIGAGGLRAGMEAGRKRGTDQLGILSAFLGATDTSEQIAQRRSLREQEQRARDAEQRAKAAELRTQQLHQHRLAQEQEQAIQRRLETQRTQRANAAERAAARQAALQVQQQTGRITEIPASDEEARAGVQQGQLTPQALRIQESRRRAGERIKPTAVEVFNQDGDSEEIFQIFDPIDGSFDPNMVTSARTAKALLEGVDKDGNPLFPEDQNALLTRYKVLLNDELVSKSKIAELGKKAVESGLDSPDNVEALLESAKVIIDLGGGGPELIRIFEKYGELLDMPSPQEIANNPKQSVEMILKRPQLAVEAFGQIFVELQELLITKLFPKRAKLRTKVRRRREEMERPVTTTAPTLERGQTYRLFGLVPLRSRK